MTANKLNIPSETIVQNAQKWLQSPQAKASIQSLLQETKNTTIRLQEERRVDLKSLHEPFTV